MDTLHGRNGIKKLGTILSVWAHPDDETFSCAGIMAQAIKNNQKVVCITATKGEKGTQDTSKWPAETLAAVRTQELKEALRIIGVKEHHWLDYHDGACQYQDDDSAAGKIATYIQKYNPDTVLTFGPEGLTGHPDHQSVSRWVSRAIELSDSNPALYHAVVAQEQYDRYLKKADEALGIFYNIKIPPIRPLSACDLSFLCDAAEMCTLKRSAIAAMPSQTEAMFTIFGEEFVESAFMTEAFIRGT